MTYVIAAVMKIDGQNAEVPPRDWCEGSVDIFKGCDFL